MSLPGKVRLQLLPRSCYNSTPVTFSLSSQDQSDKEVRIILLGRITSAYIKVKLLWEALNSHTKHNGNVKQ